MGSMGSRERQATSREPPPKAEREDRPGCQSPFSHRPQASVKCQEDTASEQEQASKPPAPSDGGWHQRARGAGPQLLSHDTAGLAGQRGAERHLCPPRMSPGLRRPSRGSGGNQECTEDSLAARGHISTCPGGAASKSKGKAAKDLTGPRVFSPAAPGTRPLHGGLLQGQGGDETDLGGGALQAGGASASISTTAGNNSSLG